MSRSVVTAWVEAVATGAWPTHEVLAPDGAAEQLKPRGGPRFYVTVAYRGSSAVRDIPVGGDDVDGQHSMELVVTGLTLADARAAAEQLASDLVMGTATTVALERPDHLQVTYGADGREGELWTAVVQVEAV